MAMEVDEDGADGTAEEDFSPVEVLKQQFLTYSHTVCRPQTPLNEKIQALHRLATLMEQEEADYRKKVSNLFVDDRDGHPVGELLTIFSTNEALRIELLNILLHHQESELHTGICRLVLSTFVGNTASIASTDDEMVEMMTKLVSFVTSENTPPALRGFATGLLAKHVEGTALASDLAKSDVPALLVKRLIQIMRDDTTGKRNGVPPGISPQALAVQVPSVSAETDAQHPPLETLHLSTVSMCYRELVYVIGCITSIAEHVETLVPILQLGGVDAIFYFLKSSELIIMFGIQAMLSKLLQHQKFASVFVDKGGIDLLVSFPRVVERGIPPAPIIAVSLLHLMSFPNVVEQICLLDDTIKSSFVAMTIWLLQHPDESSRKNMALFWTFAFGYKVLVDIFDSQDGFKVLLGELKSIISPEEDPEEPKQFPRMLVHHFCMAIRDYFRVQLVHSALPTLKRSLPADRPPTPRYRFMTVTEDMISEATENVMQTEVKIPAWQWFIREGGLDIMLQLIERSRSVSSVNMDTARMCLDVLSLVTSDKSAHSALLTLKIQPLPPQQDETADDIVPPPPQPAKSAFAVVMDTLANPNVELPQTAIAALRLLLNYVLLEPSAGSAAARRQVNRLRTPHHHHATPAQQEEAQDATRSTPAASGRNSKELPDYFRSAVRNIRTKNGISMLVHLLKLNWITPPVSVSPHGADLYEVRIAIVQVMLGLAKDPNICQVLRKKVARILPDLLRDPATTMTTPAAQGAFEQLRSVTLKLIGVLKGEDAVKLADMETRGGHYHSLSQLDRAAIVSATPINYSSNELLELVVKHLQNRGLSKSAHALVEEAGLPKELIEHTSAPSSALDAPSDHSFTATPSSKQRKRVAPGLATPGMAPKDAEEPAEPKKEDVSLDAIVRQFLHDQHRHCARPFSFVPQFTLKAPHVCPEPTRNDRAAIAPTNVARRILGGQLGSRYAYNNTAAAWRRFKYSRLRPLRDQYGLEDTQLSSVEFLGPDKLMLASELGDLFVFDLTKPETEEPVEHQCYEEAEDCRLSLDKKTRQRLLTYTWVNNQTKLWDLNKMGAPQYTLPTMCAVFNNEADVIMGTRQLGHVVLFDALTCQEVVQLYDSESNNVDPARVVVPTSSPDDALILCDAALWDSRAGKHIHKFDMFTDEAFEAFNPSGNEVIINSEVWDLRTFKLLKTCPALDQSFFTFNSTGDVIFAGLHKKQQKGLGQISNLRVIDATSYELLKEQTLDYHLVDFCVHPHDSSLGVVEKVWQRNSFCRIWDIGRTRAFDDDEDDIDEDGDADEEDSLGELADVLDGDDSDDDDDDDDSGSSDDAMMVDGGGSGDEDGDGLDEVDDDDMDDFDDVDDDDEFDDDDGAGDGIEELNYHDVMRILAGEGLSDDDDDDDSDSDD